MTIDALLVGVASPEGSVPLQNALARLGASHLAETDDALPNAHVERVEDVVVEALVTAAPRHVTALAPVLVTQTNRGHIGLLRRIDVRLTELGLERRLGWLVENINEAVRAELADGLPRPWSQVLRRVNLVFAEYLRAARERRVREPRDVLDPDIRTRKTVDEVEAASSDISREWGVVTSLQPADFQRALRAARGDH